MFSVSASELPEGFVYVKEIIPDIILDMRYHGSNNFVGESINGYIEPKCILTIDAVKNLKNVQNELRHFGLGLIIFDAYRPQMAVDHFIWWSKNKDNRMKGKYYPDIAKKDLFAKGYIASRSGHSRGSTVDLSIVSLKDKKELDMGTDYDFFSILSWPSNKDIKQTNLLYILSFHTNIYGDFIDMKYTIKQKRLLDRKVKICIGKRFVFHGEVPPLFL